jgi:exodeoxyribonuclease VII large subunit
MRRAFAQQGNLLKLSGDTFSIKDELKKIGARYDGAQKCWFISSEDQILRKLEFLGFLPASASTPAVPSAPQNDTPAPAADGDNTWSVLQFTLFVEKIFKQQLNFDFWIVGEISSLKTSSGHVYFDLTEPDSEEQRALTAGRAVSVSCCLWAGKIRALSDKLAEFQLAEGVKVKLKVNCDFRKEGSRLSLIVNDIDPQFTLGDLALKRQQIVRELKRRGLYDRQRMLCKWPELPIRIALVTACGSRAQTDFLSELSMSKLAFKVTLFDCLMQGDKVRDTVTAAIKQIGENCHDNFDCIVITRGGGSRLDLRWFDDLEICKAIAYSDLPVMTAIGHFEDVSIADEVASVAEKTPTGAARFLVNRVAAGFDRLLARLEQSARLAQQRIQREKQQLARSELRLEQSARGRIKREADTLTTSFRALKLVQNTSARPLLMGYSFVRLQSDKDDTGQGRHLTADDFLTSEPPRSVEVHMWSRSKNAQVLVEMTVQSVRQSQTQATPTDTVTGHPAHQTHSSRETHGK